MGSRPDGLRQPGNERRQGKRVRVSGVGERDEGCLWEELSEDAVLTLIGYCNVLLSPDDGERNFLRAERAVDAGQSSKGEILERAEEGSSKACQGEGGIEADLIRRSFLDALPG